MKGRTAFTHVGRLGEVLGLLRNRDRGPRYFSAAGKTSVALSSTMTPQSANFDTTAGSKIIFSESTGASAMRFLISATL